MSAPRLYGQLADWWPVMSAPSHYEEEARIYHETIARHARHPVRTMLELGSGGGNNASHLKAHYEMTLVDPSMGMREVSRALNPECAHVAGDMRDVRIEGAYFDAVFIHDAIAYMTSEADLKAAMITAYAHCKPGGIALFVPDDTRETFQPETSTGGHDVGGRSLRYLQWSYDPDPADDTYVTAFAFLLREGEGHVRFDHDEHVMGLFARETWLRLVEQAGFDARTVPYEHSSFDVKREMFVGLRPDV